MKTLLLFTVLSPLLIIYPSVAQEVFVDVRDGQEYATVSIAGTTWMTENLNFKTELSISSDPQKTINPKLSGRYYHVQEICCVCPDGWRLPGIEDWLGYFSNMLKAADSLAPLKFMGANDHFAIDQYSQYVDLFAEGNPLKLTGTGRVQGGGYQIPEKYADYWAADPPEWGHDLSNTTADHTHVLSTVYDGKTHIHIRSGSFTNLHSHEHHLNPQKEKKLRMFMIRCAKTVE